MVPPGVSYTPLDFIPTTRFSTISIIPIPFAPPSSFNLVIISETFIFSPFRATGIPDSKLSEISVSLSGAFCGVTPSISTWS